MEPRRAVLFWATVATCSCAEGGGEFASAPVRDGGLLDAAMRDAGPAPPDAGPPTPCRAPGPPRISPGPAVLVDPLEIALDDVGVGASLALLIRFDGQRDINARLEGRDAAAFGLSPALPSDFGGRATWRLTLQADTPGDLDATLVVQGDGSEPQRIPIEIMVQDGPAVRCRLRAPPVLMGVGQRQLLTLRCTERLGTRSARTPNDLTLTLDGAVEPLSSDLQPSVDLSPLSSAEWDFEVCAEELGTFTVTASSALGAEVAEGEVIGARILHPEVVPMLIGPRTRGSATIELVNAGFEDYVLEDVRVFPPPYSAEFTKSRIEPGETADVVVGYASSSFFSPREVRSATALLAGSDGARSISIPTRVDPKLVDVSCTYGLDFQEEGLNFGAVSAQSPAAGTLSLVRRSLRHCTLVVEPPPEVRVTRQCVAADQLTPFSDDWAEGAVVVHLDGGGSSARLDLEIDTARLPLGPFSLPLVLHDPYGNGPSRILRLVGEKVEEGKNLSHTFRTLSDRGDWRLDLPDTDLSDVVLDGAGLHADPAAGGGVEVRLASCAGGHPGGTVWVGEQAVPVGLRPSQACRDRRDALHYDRFLTFERPMLDVTILLDDSGSIRPYADPILENIEAYARVLEAQTFDYRIQVLGVSAEAAPSVTVTPRTQPSPLQVLISGSARHLAAALDAREAPIERLGQSALEPRAGARQVVLLVTDEDDATSSLDAELAVAERLRQGFEMYAVFPGRAGCDAAPAAPRLAALAERHAYRGGIRALSICDPDWSRHLPFGQPSREGWGPRRFRLTAFPADPTHMQVFVNSQETDRWTYDFSFNAVSLVPSALPVPGERVEVYFAPDCSP